MNLWHGAFESTLRANKNWGRWSDIVAIILPAYTLWEIILENILSMRLFEWLVILAGCKIYRVKEIEATESKNSFVD